MLHKLFEDGDWFAPKRFGYGAGLPIAWQGWVVCALYFGVLGGIALLDKSGGTGAKAGSFTLFLLATSVFALIVARHTRGGWKWRWGGD